jgi:hypothetical protein
MPTIMIRDESLQGTQPSWQLDILEEQSTLREVIRSRIYQDVREYNAKKRSQVRCLLPPTSLWQVLAEHTPTLDWQVQYDQAIKAFEKRSYIVLIDDQQITQLDSPMRLSAQSTVTFFKLIPLIGG